MKIVAGAMSGTMTLKDLKKLVNRAEILGLPDDARIGAKVVVSIKDHAGIKSMSVEDEEG
jgi:hypothetical protein